MPSQRITVPVILDSTGQDIVTKLNEMKSVIQPVNPCYDIDISIPASGWSSSSPYQYTYSNEHITTGCSVDVAFLETSDSTGPLYLEYEKVVGGVRFYAPSVPTQAIPVRIHVLNADATSPSSMVASAVTTDAVSGALNVQDALTNLDGRMVTLNSQTAATSAIVTRKDSSTSGSFATWAESNVEAGKMQYFRMRTGEPSSAWNYSCGIIFRPTDANFMGIMIHREDPTKVAYINKYNGVWSSWTDPLTIATTPVAYTGADNVITAASGFTVSQVNTVKCGNIVTIRFQVSKTTGNFVEDDLLATVANILKPKVDSFLSVIKYGQYSSIEIASIKTNGQILFWNKNHSGFDGGVQIFGTYIAN